MSNTITAGRTLIPSEHVALVEPFDREANPGLRTSRDFRARLVLVNRNSLLIEESPEAFAKAYGFRMLAAESVATNPALPFRVERFEPVEGFTPTKPYATRLRWRDPDGNDQSKLLLTPPEEVVAIAVKGETGSQAPDAPPAVASAGRRGRRASATPGAKP